MNTEGSPPSKNIPVIWGDYNAVGLSGEADDNCIYSLHRDELARLGAEEGKVFFVYEDDLDDSDQPEVFGYICKLEKMKGIYARGELVQMNLLGIEVQKHGKYQATYNKFRQSENLLRLDLAP